MTDVSEVSINEVQWAEMMLLGREFVTKSIEWGKEHNMPLPVVVGMMLGFADATFHLLGGCDCEACNDIENMVAAQVVQEFGQAFGIDPDKIGRVI